MARVRSGSWSGCNVAVQINAAMNTNEKKMMLWCLALESCEYDLRPEIDLQFDSCACRVSVTSWAQKLLMTKRTQFPFEMIAFFFLCCFGSGLRSPPSFY